MPDDCRPDKRKRTSSPSIDENSVIVRSTVWYDDGSVVLQAECTQFRVHRTLLCQNSTIFTDMFSIPQPSQEESLVEGCPLVRLSDSAEEVETILRALYFHTYVCSFPAVPLRTFSFKGWTTNSLSPSWRFTFGWEENTTSVV